MAREFTIGFEYKNKCRLAMMSIQPRKDNNTPLIVEVLNNGFCKKTIPDGKITFYLADGKLTPVNIKNEEAVELISCIGASVLGHIKVLDKMP